MWFEVYLFLALIIAFIFTAAVGLILERGVTRYLYGRPLETLLATWGVSLIFQQFVRSVNWVLIVGRGGSYDRTFPDDQNRIQESGARIQN